ncbi:MAG TPA: hypothetical protein PLN39_02455 [Candidatus Dojkabacteria bacterium]|nr:hypothetical protein [Candidatus Dojkabacteria bacterium]
MEEFPQQNSADWDDGDIGESDWDDNSEETDYSKNPATSLILAGKIDSDFKIPEKPLREEKDRPIVEEVVSLQEAISELSDMRYELRGHGTSSESNAKSILEGGLLVKYSPILSNAISLPRKEQELKECLDNWEHRDSKYIALLRFPAKYKLPFYSSEKVYGVFYTKVNSDSSYDEVEGIYEGEYIYGYYNANTGMVHKNPRYRGNLDKEEDVKYIEKVYSNICDVVRESLQGDERESWDEERKTFYDYNPGEDNK